MEGAVVSEVLFEFAIHRSVPKIFAIKVESCQKSRQILEVFTPSEILGGVSPISYTHFITAASWHIAWKNFCEDTPTSPEVIGAHIDQLKRIFCGTLHFGLWGVLPPQIFTRVTD